MKKRLLRPLTCVNVDIGSEIRFLDFPGSSA